MGLRSRIQRLESRSTDAFKLIIVSGGLPGETRHAVAGSQRFERDDDEEFDVFVERVRAAALAGGHDLCVIGGLPDV